MLNMLTTRPRGTNDILPDEVLRWQYIEDVFRQLCQDYGFTEIRTPVFEHTELFIRSVGEVTDIVTKEMYTFTDRGERSLTLRPEGTAAVARAYLESGLKSGPQPAKLYYLGPMFRYDRPQAGRYRQFHQGGVEIFGTNNPEADIEVIALAVDFYRRLGLQNFELHLNSIGCKVCRPVLKEKLSFFFKTRQKELCLNCQERLAYNPLRILDCKEPQDQEIARGAPDSLSCLCPSCVAHFDAVLGYLKALKIPYLIDKQLVRGLDYYTRTTFEIMVADIGAQSSIGGGGRYDDLVAALGGPPTPGIGFAVGLERVLLTMNKQNTPFPTPKNLDVFIVEADEEASGAALELLFFVRAQGLSADKDFLGRSLKAQMKYAAKKRARFVVILGKEELSRQIVSLKDLSSGEQREVSPAKIKEEIRRRYRQDIVT
jgi:histidyl-tRNA synthetase